MSVDLRLVPIERLYESFDPCWAVSHAVLDLPTNRAAWDAIRALPSEPVPASARVFSHVGRRVPDGKAKGELMYGQMSPEDAYGTPRAWVRARDLIPVLSQFFPGHPATAYVGALAGDVRVLLDWH